MYFETSIGDLTVPKKYDIILDHNTLLKVIPEVSFTKKPETNKYTNFISKIYTWTVSL